MAATTLEQWRMFLAVIDYQGFSAAAKPLFKSQSTVHHAINNLEERLALKLFEVQGKKLVLTEAGRLMEKKARALLAQEKKLAALADALSHGIESRFSLAVDQAISLNWLMPALNCIDQEFADVSIDMQHTVLSGANELLHQGEVQLVISPEPLKECVSEQCLTQRFIAVAATSHPLALQDELRLDDLISYRQIIVRDSGKAHSNRGIDAGWHGADRHWRVSSMQASIELVTSGLGFAWLPVSLIEQELESGQLTPLKLVEQASREERFYLNYLDHDRLGPVAKVFVEQIRSNLSNISS